MAYLKSTDPSITRTHLPYGPARPGETLCGIVAGLVETAAPGDGGTCGECCRRRYLTETDRVDHARRQMMRAEV